MTKEQFEQLYKLMEQAVAEMNTTQYSCKNCNTVASVVETGVVKNCSCEAPVVVNIASNMHIKANLSN